MNIESKEYTTRFFPAENRRGVCNELASIYRTGSGEVEIDDIELQPWKEIEYALDFDSVFVIPVTGSCQVKTGGRDYYVHSEELLSIQLPVGKSVTLTNQLEYVVTLLVVGLKAKNSWPGVSLGKIIFPGKNTFNTIDTKAWLRIGVFGGRHQGTYENPSLPHITMAYAIAGSFEIENRLLNQGDALWFERKQIEFESLTDFAILLFIQMPDNL